MSGEYGSGSLFFHEKVAQAANDAREASHPAAKGWGDLLDAVYPVARAISYVEAGDSSSEAVDEASLDAAEECLEIVDRIRWQTESARRLKMAELVALLRAIIKPELRDDKVVMVFPGNFAERYCGERKVRARWLGDALTEAVRQWAISYVGREKAWRLTRESSSTRGGDDYSTYTYGFDREVWRLRQAVAAALEVGDIPRAMSLLREV